MNKQSASHTALQRLVEGNERFVKGLRSVEAFPTLDRLKELATKGQRPFAIILTCSDSRVPTEIVFDQGMGDLFVVRVAGNVVAPSLIASMEFAASQFETPLLLVMGHSSCGAVKAAMDHKAGLLPGLTPNLQDLVARIEPSVMGGSVEECIRHNVMNSMRVIQDSSPLLADRVKSGLLKMVGCVFDFNTGRVTFEESNKNRPDAAPFSRLHHETSHTKTPYFFAELH